MFRTRVLTFLWLFVRLAHSFSWDIVLGEDNRLEFYYNGTITHTEVIPSASYITSVTYDPVHNRVLFADDEYPNEDISSFDLSTRKIQPLVRTTYGYYVKVVYDPVTQLLFWKDGNSIYSLSLNPASSDKAVDRKLLVTTDHDCWDIAVDSCGGYIYWITDHNIERARFDGSEREVLIDSYVSYRLSLDIDQQTQKIYWTETNDVNGNYQLSIASASFNGNNRTTLHNIIGRDSSYIYSLAVSKDFIYWKEYNQVGIWQLPKTPSQQLEGKLFSKSSSDRQYCHHIAASYTIKEQIQGIKNCEALQYLIPNNPKPESTVTICQNYCLQGDCSVSAEGQPTCSCKSGYSGERCEVNACHKHCLNNGVCSLNEEDAPVCHCTAGYDGERCDISICKDYCLQGNCSVGTEGQPKCSCKAGYSGERCDVPAFLIKCIQTVSMLKDMLNTDVTPVTLGKGVKTSCATTVV